ncbi:MAG: glycosyltransferase family 61 protein [Egibacteraceae bacterium]
MFDVLPRLDTLRASGRLRDDDLLLVNSLRYRFQIETLEALGVSRRRVLTTSTMPHLQADVLIVPSLARRGDTVPPRTCTFLRDTLLPCGARSSHGPRRLFISRSDARWRRLVNEDEVARALAQRGFTTVTGLGQLPLAEHVGIFAGAEAIVCAYGAGMVNTVFCQPGAVVVELFSGDFVDPHYWTIDERVGTTYR